MKRLFRILQMIPLAFVCAMFLYAAASVQRDRAEAVDAPALPTRLGQAQTEQSFLAATFQEMNTMWTDFYIAFVPGLIPAPVAQSREDQSGLKALQNRTRNEANGRDASGLPKISF